MMSNIFAVTSPLARRRKDRTAPIPRAQLVPRLGRAGVLWPRATWAWAALLASGGMLSAATNRQPTPPPSEVVPTPTRAEFAPAPGDGPQTLAPLPSGSAALRPSPDLQLPLSTPTTQGMALSDLENMALSLNPSLARSAALVGVARGRWVQSGLYSNPETGYQGQQLGSGGRAEQHGVVVQQELIRGGKLRLNRSVNSRYIVEAQRNLDAQRLRVLTDVRVAYFSVLVAERQQDLANRLVQIAGQTSQAATALFNAKEVSRADVLQAELETENARILFSNARNRYAAAWQSLGAVVGDPTLTPQALRGDVFLPPREYNFEDALLTLRTSSPELAAAAARIDRARFAVERARVEPRPNPTVQGLVNVIDNGINGLPDGGVTLTMPIPVLNANQGGIYAAQQELLAASREFDQLELGMKARLAPVFEQYARSRNAVERYRTTILTAAQRTLELTRRMYEAGEINYVSLLTVQRTYFQTNINYLAALLELRTAEAQIEGLLLSDSLTPQPPGTTAPTPP